MRALTLWQPWASLIAAGVKVHETRSWMLPRTIPLGTRIAIHASARPIARPFRREITPLTTLCRRTFGLVWWDLPLGAIVATAEVVDCLPVEEVLARPVTPAGTDDLLCGDYSPGRWAWRLENVEVVSPCIPVRGRQGLWTYGDLV